MTPQCLRDIACGFHAQANGKIYPRCLGLLSPAVKYAPCLGLHFIGGWSQAYGTTLLLEALADSANPLASVLYPSLSGPVSETAFICPNPGPAFACNQHGTAAMGTQISIFQYPTSRETCGNHPKLSEPSIQRGLEETNLDGMDKSGQRSGVRSRRRWISGIEQNSGEIE